MKRVLGILAAGALAVSLAACATSGAGSAKVELASAATVAGAAQTWWIDNCVNAKIASFCTDPATKAKVKAASQAATDAATANTLDAATITQLINDANAAALSFEALITSLKSQH